MYFPISETWRLDAGREPQLRFYRDDSKVEVDLLDMTNPGSPELVEVKSTRTYSASLTRNLAKVGELLGIPLENRHLVMRSETTRRIAGVRVWSAEGWMLRKTGTAV